MSKVPKLNASAPTRFGFVALGCSILLIISLFVIDVDQGPVASTAAVKRAEPVVVRHDMAGQLAQIHAVVGMDVEAGALLAQFDRRHIEGELAALRKRIDARRMEIDGLKLEAAALAAAGDKTTVRGRIAALDAEALEADRVIVGHSARVALLEGQLDRLEIRAPVAGRVIDVIQGGSGATVAAKAPLVTIRPSLNRLQLDVSWPASAVAIPAPGQAARVWTAGTVAMGRALAGKVESVGADVGAETVGNADGRPETGRPETGRHETRARIALDVSGTPLADISSGELTLNVQLVTGSKSLAEHLFAPLIVRPTSDKNSTEGLPR